MAMGRRPKQQQQDLWVEATAVPRGPGHPFYLRLNQVFDQHGFDDFVEKLCQKFYAGVMGRPSMAPGIYFRMMLIGYFEGLGSERGIAWRTEDSLSLREFLGLELAKKPPEHSTLSRTRRLIDLETHQEVFAWLVEVLAKEGLVNGKTVGIDATTLEANAALRSIIRRDTGESYDAYLERLAKASGIETPTREDLAKVDKKRPQKGSNADWVNPNDPETTITKMKDGTTHLAYKVEHAVDMETGALLGVTLHTGTAGDTQTIGETEEEAKAVLADVLDCPEASAQLTGEVFAEVVADKGYHSNAVLTAHQQEGVRTYISEPDRGKRRWAGKPEAKAATYGNRRRIRGKRGRQLLRSRGEKVERSFAHCYETGGMRRLHLRGRENALKRLLVHDGGYNLSLLMRQLCSVGKPRVLQGLSRVLQGLSGCLLALLRLLEALRRAIWQYLLAKWTSLRRFELEGQLAFAYCHISTPSR